MPCGQALIPRIKRRAADLDPKLRERRYDSVAELESTKVETGWANRDALADVA